MPNRDRKPWEPNLTAALLVALVVWTIGIFNRSLWIDEFHSLEHARAADFSAFLESLHTSNHPPLSILLLRWSTWLFGESELAMRWWAMALGLATIVMTTRVAFRLPGDSARRVAPWLVVASSFAFTIFSECRMYALVTLATLGLVETILATLKGESRGWWAAVWIAIGLHSHYYFLHFGFVLAVTTIVVGVARPNARPGMVRLIVPALVGLALFLPWGLTGFVAQLSHELPSGGSTRLYLNLMGYCQSIAHLLFLGASIGGEWLTLYVALPGAVAGGVLGALGLLRLWQRREDCGLLMVYLIAAGLLAPAWAFFVAIVYERAGYHWRYIAGACVPVLLIIAAGVRWRPWPRAALAVVLLATMAMVTLVNAFSAGRDDFRDCVSHIIANARPGDAVLIKHLRGVDPERGLTGWDYYRQRVDRPDGATEPVSYRLSRHEAAMQHDRVWLFIRYRFPADILAKLDAHYPKHEVTRIGLVMTVHSYSR